MKNLLTPDDIEFKMVKHLNLANGGHGLSYCKEYGIQWERITKKNKHGDWGKQKNYYFIEGQEKEYTDLQALCDDWNEIKNFDDPNSEITWVKVVKKKTDQ